MYTNVSTSSLLIPQDDHVERVPTAPYSHSPNTSGGFSRTNSMEGLEGLKLMAHVEPEGGSADAPVPQRRLSSAKAEGRSKRGKSVKRDLIPAPKTSEHLGLGFPEFVDLLHSISFHIYSSDDLFEAAYPTQEAKVSLIHTYSGAF